MLVDVYVSGELEYNNEHDNGVNFTFRRADNDKLVSIKIEDDGGKCLLREIIFNYKELKKAILKIDWND